MSTDPEHRFELALQLGELKIAYQVAVEAEVRQHIKRKSWNAREVLRNVGPNVDICRHIWRPTGYIYLKGISYHIFN